MSEQPQEPVMPFVAPDDVESEVPATELVMPFVHEEKKAARKTAAASKASGKASR